MKTYGLIFFVSFFIYSLVPQIANSQKQAYHPPYTTSLIHHFAEINNWRMAIYYTMQLGDSAQNVGDFAEAEKQYLNALEYTQKVIDEGGPYRNIILESAFDPYERLANMYVQANNLRKAELYFTKAKDEKNKYLGRSNVFKVSPYIGLGRIQLLRGDLTEASATFTYAEKLLNSATTSGYDFGIPQREILLNQYEVVMKQKNYKKAFHYLNRLSYGGQGEQIPRVFQLKAHYYLVTGDYPKCEYYLKKAKLYSRNLSFSTVSFKILRTKALLFWVQGHIEESSQTFNALIASYQEYIQKNFASMTEYERESFYALLRDDVDLFNAFAVETSRIENPQPRFEKMYNNQLFSKALLLNEINKLKDRIRNSTDQQLKNDFIEWENQKALLTSLYFAKKKNTYAISEAETRIEELEQRLNTQTLQTTSLPHQWKEIQSTLKDGEAAIEIIRTKKFALTGISKFEFSDSIVYAALIIDTQVQSPKLVLIENGNDLENKYLAYYRNSIISKQPDTLSYRQFWLPIQNKLGQYKKLYVSSDGVYNQVNLNILLNPATRHYLLDEIDVAFVTNTKDLLRKSQATTSKNSYLYARPEYRIDSVKKIQSITPGGETKRSLTSEDLENFRDQEFEDLPGTEQEIKSLQKILLQHGWLVHTNIGENASEANIKSSKNPGVLHIATHGFFLKENAQEKISSMIRSGIILAGVNNTDDQFEDGVLTASEATNLQLDSTYLVVLSACETGLGDVKNGEGVYGLQRGFIVAGTKYLLMSLWKIDDLATASLMENIYSEWLKSGDLPASVKEAQLLLREDYPQPFYWGSFILLGN